MKSFVIALLIAGAVVAQPISWIDGPFDSSLKAYLALTDEQIAKIRANNDALMSRILLEPSSSLSFAIINELAKPAPDPSIVGKFYAELEYGCREKARLTAGTRAQNVSLLSDVQKAKLKVLTEASRLASVIQEAESANLYRANTGFASFLLGGVGFPVGTGIVVGIPRPGQPSCFSTLRFGNFGPVVP